MEWRRERFVSSKPSHRGLRDKEQLVSSLKCIEYVEVLDSVDMPDWSGLKVSFSDKSLPNICPGLIFESKEYSPPDVVANAHIKQKLRDRAALDVTDVSIDIGVDLIPADSYTAIRFWHSLLWQRSKCCINLFVVTQPENWQEFEEHPLI